MKRSIVAVSACIFSICLATSLFTRDPANRGLRPERPWAQREYSELADPGLVTIKIYSVTGQLVKTLVDEVKDAGFHAVVWDGANNAGAPVASGVYFYRMESTSFSATRKLVMLR